MAGHDDMDSFLLFPACGPAADVVLMLDSSSSVGSVTFDRIKVYAQRMVSEMDTLSCGINIGVMKYSSAAMVQFHLGVYSEEDDINRAIQGIYYTPGPAYLAEALRVMRTQMFNGMNGDRLVNDMKKNISFFIHVCVSNFIFGLM